MRTKSVLGLAALGFMLLSCQSNSYKINGFALQLEEGDTILIAHDSDRLQPFAMTIVNGGIFFWEGDINDVEPCWVYLKRRPECNAFYFPDNGTIAIELNLPPTPSRVSGTLLNNKWQHLNDSIQRIGKNIISLMEQKDSDTLAHMTKHKRVDSLHYLMSALIINTGKRNKGNPLGNFILENYKEPEFK